MNPDPEELKRAQAEMQQALVGRLGNLVVELYNLLDAVSQGGALTVHVDIRGGEAILVPGRAPKKKRLTIIKPSLVINLDLTEQPRAHDEGLKP